MKIKIENIPEYCKDCKDKKYYPKCKDGCLSLLFKIPHKEDK
jgi:hypothetical protein